MLKTECDHAGQIVAGVEPKAAVCETCGIEGPLRMCATCGYVGCCESKNSHDTDHWQETGHSIIMRMPINTDSFTYCYEHKDYLK
jgi:uncharacterized UBP type Zn finger protein